MTEAPSMLDSPLARIGLMILTAVLLNIGLFFILAFFAPLVAGLVVGFFLERKDIGTLAGFLGAVFSYSGILFVTEYLTGFSTDFLTLIAAVFLMGLFGALGGVLGVFIRSRSK
ncbi:MAG: hypothetical protein RTV41_00785 [Candidatus Thorarchaeota archaeon]